MEDICIKTLDCTLRDGGYINDWKFSYGNAKEIVAGLNRANIEIIEVGFLDHDADGIAEGTKFKTVNQIKSVIPETMICQAKIVAMIMLGKFQASEIPNRDDCILDGIRICFKKDQLHEAMDLADKIAKKGFDIYIQPASITDYSNEEIEKLLLAVNDIHPLAVYIVDTYGLMNKEEVLEVYKRFNQFLLDDIHIGFHSHNNLQLSFANSKELIEASEGRFLIVDSCVFGMGRGAGNLCTELITKYINEKYEKRYDLLPIMEIVDKYIDPLFKIYSWGYSVPYYVAALAKCHPNYATFLADKHSLGVNAIHNILTCIPEDKKRNYDESEIKQLYVQYQKKDIDDEKTLLEFAERIQDKKVLLLAPGSSIKKEYEGIKQFILTEVPFCISINFVPETIEADIVFFCNRKRYDEQKLKINKCNKIMLSSNISDEESLGKMIVNYNALINSDYATPDISGAMALRLLTKIGVKEVYLAGFDGFSVDYRESFFDASFSYGIDSEVNRNRNDDFEKQLKVLSKQIKINFITDSLYKI